jgi:alkyl hydroperoxide reductase subunit F
VATTPKTIINDVHSFEGTILPGAFYLEILKTVNPEEYRRIEQTMGEMQGTRKVKTVDENHLYELIVVGGGPAAMSAAIFGARKGLDVALVAETLGGQITNTARIENYLGFPAIEGNNLAEIFRVHMEGFPISEVLGTKVMSVKNHDNRFTVVTEDKRSLSASALIYCAGKEYRRLGIPGEDRFVGKGIAFCATCDAPLYLNKRVAIVGGGNSAFTSARDLLSFASEVHIIHRRREFRADPELVNEVLATKNVTLHVPMIVRSFLGKDRLSGVRLESEDGKDRYDINVDGVFLEVGLTPNTAPLRDILTLNENGEVIAGKDMSTAVPGLYAAGDVTDTEEKQVCIAVGQGALAAIAAHKYLAKERMTASKIGLKESWQ